MTKSENFNKKGGIIMYHVGVDLHKETSWLYIIDSNGKKVDSKNILNLS
jgi:hypothetical protein